MMKTLRPVLIVEILCTATIVLYLIHKGLLADASNAGLVGTFLAIMIGFIGLIGND